MDDRNDYNSLNEDTVDHSEGIALIAKERFEQIHKHGYTVENDEFYTDNELIKAALFCINHRQFEWPFYWNNDTRDKVKYEKTEIQRLATAGAFIAARIDQILHNQKK